MRGPESALYGASAFLGVINIVSKQGYGVANSLVTYSLEVEQGNTIGNRVNLRSGASSDDSKFSINLNYLTEPGAEYNYSQPAQPEINSAYLEYVWHKNKTLFLNAAIRWDDYSDFAFNVFL